MASSLSSGRQAPVRAAILGYGLAGSVFHAPLIASVTGMEVAAIVTANPERQERARRDYPTALVLPAADSLFADPKSVDLVVVAAPNNSHLTLGLAAIQAGLPVVIDKPFAATSSDARQLIEAARVAGVPLTVFQSRRWDSDFRTLQALLAAGALGDIVRFESRYERYRPMVNANAWREHAAPGEAGGLLFDLGAHLVDQALSLLGDPVTVYAESDARRPGAQVDDDTFVALRFANGSVAQLWMSMLVRRNAPRYRVIGTRGLYEKYGMDPQEDMLRAGGRPGDEGWGQEPESIWGHLYTDAGEVSVAGVARSLPGSYETFYQMMRDALRSGGPLPVDARDALKTIQVIEAARESAASGQVVRFDALG
ncbi:MAG TPA: Gfo/Idh/MocA family oxidoreductase [Ktedonobacterales bacterium]|nr:Gfo/Idh/MocA family oxidoreductase [Ktedonobacterales bacterium]